MALTDPDILLRFDEEVRRKPSMLASDYVQETDAGGVNRTFGPFPTAMQNWIDFHDFGHRHIGCLLLC